MPRENAKKKKKKGRRGAGAAPTDDAVENEAPPVVEEVPVSEKKNERKARRAARDEKSTLSGVDEMLAKGVQTGKFKRAGVAPRGPARNFTNLIDEIKRLQWTKISMMPTADALKVVDPIVERARAFMNARDEADSGLSSPAIGYLFKSAAGLRQMQLDEADDDATKDELRAIRHLIVRDCTEAIKVYEGSILLRGVFNASTRAEFRFIQSLALWYRGRARVGLGDEDLDAAKSGLDDFVAALAAMRLGKVMPATNLCGGQLMAADTSKDVYLIKILHEALTTLAFMVLVSTWDNLDQRSYLSPERRRKYRKDLGLGEYHRTRYKCHGCGWTPDEDTGHDKKSLRLCSGCLQVHFCGSDCMRAHWKQHKPQCQAAQRQPDHNILQLPPHRVPEILAETNHRHFYVGPGTTADVPLVTIVEDHKTQTYFELLTDADVVFHTMPPSPPP